MKYVQGCILSDEVIIKNLNKYIGLPIHNIPVPEKSQINDDRSLEEMINEGDTVLFDGQIGDFAYNYSEPWHRNKQYKL
ncbi:hypothetical protein KY334_04340 [Candidatus Woesearchaeota archaeon]|nr:hypothetical protein [Candidatus Woesearchaeota archaeon]